MADRSPHVGFVSTRLAGTDGVSLEAFKWCRALTSMGLECFYFAGECSAPEDRSLVIPEAHFLHPAILALTEQLTSGPTRTEAVTHEVQALKALLKAGLREFVDRFGIDLLIVENSLSLPVNVPLGLALAEFIAETRLPTIGHHHDFSWERKRFALHAAGDFLRAAFPPNLPSLRHVVINSFAARQLALRVGVSSILIPNVMDFDSPPPEPDGFANDLPAALGLLPEELLILQPTRVVPRKRIELAIELVRRLGRPATLVVSHSTGDEGSSYEAHLRSYADLLGARVIFASDVFAVERRILPDGRRLYSTADAYQQARLVTYPSTVEGFGNAFLEALYYRRPLVMSRYEIYRSDIQPKGFRIIAFDEFISDETLDRVRRVLDDPGLADEIGHHNYELGRRYYSFRTLERRLALLVQDALGTDPEDYLFASS
ncbi:MAG TPA: glycosyltransferase family 4 protein [Anaerolineales bacterium]|nr:glycosyltransferase family 4 protein [Anaerolineales bacterium]